MARGSTGAVGRIMVTGPPPIVHLPRLEGSAQGSSRGPAADAAGTGAAGQAGAQAQTGSARKARAKRRGLTNQEKSAFISKRRYLIVKRRERMSPGSDSTWRRC